jgi:hypothetical protein
MAIADLIRSLELESLDELLDRYKIHRDEPNRWFLLARELANTHEPAFNYSASRRVGRPRNFKKGQSLADFLGGSPPKKGKSGRKIENTDNRYKRLLKDVRETCLARGFTGRGAITKALTEIILKVARDQNLSEVQALKTHLKFFQKRYSEAKKKFPEMA